MFLPPFFKYLEKSSTLWPSTKVQWGSRVALYTRMLCVFAFMPPDNVIAGFEELSDLIRDTYHDEMDDLLD